jgi:hypothetical protein
MNIHGSGELFYIRIGWEAVLPGNTLYTTYWKSIPPHLLHHPHLPPHVILGLPSLNYLNRTKKKLAAKVGRA